MKSVCMIILVLSTASFSTESFSILGAKYGSISNYQNINAEDSIENNKEKIEDSLERVEKKNDRIQDSIQDVHAGPKAGLYD